MFLIRNTASHYGSRSPKRCRQIMDTDAHNLQGESHRSLCNYPELHFTWILSASRGTPGSCTISRAISHLQIQEPKRRSGITNENNFERQHRKKITPRKRSIVHPVHFQNRKYDVPLLRNLDESSLVIMLSELSSRLSAAAMGWNTGIKINQ